MSYAYQPLAEGQAFRILELQPAATIDEPLLARFVFSGSGEIDFAAISYTWGKDELCKAVELEGTSLPITFNLWNALRHFRLKDSVRMLWADGICIN